MRYLIAAVCLLAGVLLPGKELKVLMIGNSFSQCLGVYLPQLVNAEQKHQLLLTSAYIGGCSLKKHYNHLLKAEKDPKFNPYKTTIWNSANGQKKVIQTNLNSLLKNNKYDVITMQQSSQVSWKLESFEPYMTELVKYIRQYQPQAEIVIHQTWAYRVDSPRLTKWQIDQQTMHEKVIASYGAIAEKYQFRIIPMGEAVGIYRKTSPVKYVPFDKTAQLTAPPSFAGDTVGISLWQTNRKTKKRFIHHDYSHLNTSGHYMQAVLWYAFLFDEPAQQVKFTPEKIAPQDAELLRNCAAQAMKKYQKK